MHKTTLPLLLSLAICGKQGLYAMEQAPTRNQSLPSCELSRSRPLNNVSGHQAVDYHALINTILVDGQLLAWARSSEPTAAAKITALIEHQADPNTRTHLSGYSALQTAAMTPNIASVKALVVAGATVDERVISCLKGVRDASYASERKESLNEIIDYLTQIRDEQANQAPKEAKEE
ncbi:MAG: hypothetical protein AB7F19_00290 [Candidatus Babeliales bacterium]